jgi:hypothetical protein
MSINKNKNKLDLPDYSELLKYGDNGRQSCSVCSKTIPKEILRNRR